MDAENKERAKWSKLNVHVVCHIDQVFKWYICMQGITIFRKIFNFSFFRRFEQTTTATEWLYCAEKMCYFVRAKIRRGKVFVMLGTSPAVAFSSFFFFIFAISTYALFRSEGSDHFLVRFPLFLAKN